MLIHTPVEKYNGIYVKREDLAVNDPTAPPFSKMRGVLIHLTKLRDQGIKTVGYAESAISMAGWGLAWTAMQLGLKAVIFAPVYKCDHPYLEVLRKHRKHWERCGAQIVPMPAGRTKIIYYQGRKWMEDHYPKNSEMLPIGMSFPETVDATAAEYIWTLKEYKLQPKNVVLCVGSGTIAAGVARGIAESNLKTNLWGILTRDGSLSEKLRYMEKLAGFPLSSEGMLGTFSSASVTLLSSGFEYTQKSKIVVPFPCNPYYDAKAWEWLVSRKSTYEEFNRKQTLFWNIGA